MHTLLDRAAKAVAAANTAIRALIVAARVICGDETPLRAGPGPKSSKIYLKVACTGLLTHLRGWPRTSRRGSRLRIRYRRSGAAAARRRTVDRMACCCADRWYLIADADARPRMFALARLEGWEVMDEPRPLRTGAALVDIARRILGSRLQSVSHADHDARATITVGYEDLDGARQLLQFSDHPVLQ